MKITEQSRWFPVLFRSCIIVCLFLSMEPRRLTRNCTFPLYPRKFGNKQARDRSILTDKTPRHEASLWNELWNFSAIHGNYDWNGRINAKKMELINREIARDRYVDFTVVPKPVPCPSFAAIFPRSGFLAGEEPTKLKGNPFDHLPLRGDL